MIQRKRTEVDQTNQRKYEQSGAMPSAAWVLSLNNLQVYSLKDYPIAKKEIYYLRLRWRNKWA